MMSFTVLTRSIRPLEVSTAAFNFFCDILTQALTKDSIFVCVVGDRLQFLTWNKHWSPFGCDWVMKEATTPCSKTAGKFSTHQAWVLLEVWEGAPSCWKVKSSFLKCSFMPKYHRCTYLCWLWHRVSQKSEEISKFLTLQPKPWEMVASRGDKRLTCLQVRPLSVGPALCRFVDCTLPPKWIFFRLENDFTFLRAKFQQIQKKTSSIRFLIFERQ